MRMCFEIQDENMKNQARDFCARMQQYEERKRSIEQEFRALGVKGYINSPCLEAVVFGGSAELKPGMFIEVPREIIGDRIGYDMTAYIPNPNHPEGRIIHQKMAEINRPLASLEGVQPYVVDNDAIRFTRILERDGKFYVDGPDSAFKSTQGLRPVVAPREDGPSVDRSAVLSKTSAPKLKV